MRRKHRRKWIKAIRWLALILCVSAFCLPMLGLSMQGDVAAEEAVEVVVVEPDQSVLDEAAPEPQPIEPEPEPEPIAESASEVIVLESAKPEPQSSEPDASVPVVEPEPTALAPTPPAIEPEEPHTPSDAGDEPTPIPEPVPEPEPTREPPPEPSGCPAPEPTQQITPIPTDEPEPTPAPDALYNLLVDAPTVWMTDPVKITVRIEDVNGVGWSGIVAQVTGEDGARDISATLSASGIADVEINDNCTVTAVVTDPQGKSHEFSKKVVCYDRTPPKVKAAIEGRVLRMKATDDLSGVAYLYVNNQRFDKLDEGKVLDVALKELDDYKEYKQFRVRGIDWAGNESEEIKLKNPLYKSGSSGSSGSGSNGGSGAAPVYPAKPTPPTTTATPEPTNAPDATLAPEQPIPSPIPAPIPTPIPPPNPFSVDGTGTVMNYAGSSDGKEFFIVTTPNENTFYLVIDRQRGTENVYFLDAVTETDLLSLAEASGEVLPTPEPTPTPVPTPIPTPVPATEPPPPEKNNSSMIFLVILAALAAGGAGYYFKIVKPRQHQEMLEYDETDEPDDEPYDMDYSDDEDEPQA